MKTFEDYIDESEKSMGQSVQASILNKNTENIQRQIDRINKLTEQSMNINAKSTRIGIQYAS